MNLLHVQVIEDMYKEIEKELDVFVVDIVQVDGMQDIHQEMKERFDLIVVNTVKVHKK